MKTIEEKQAESLNEIAAAFGYAINRLNVDASGTRFSTGAVVDLCVQITQKEIAKRVSTIEAKNAALVAALGKIKEEHGYRYTYGDGFGNVTEKRLSSLGVAIDLVIKANEKGGRG